MPRGSVTNFPKLMSTVGRLLPALALLGVSLMPPPVAAQSTGQQKIAVALQAQMAANPSTLIPIIIQMNPPTAPFSSRINQSLANRAYSILQANGVAYGSLPVVIGAAGAALPAAITAISLLPEVAEIDLDAVVHVHRPSGGSGSSFTSSALLSSLDVQEINAPRVWQQGITGRGVNVAVIDSGVAEDLDLVQNGPRVLAHLNFAGPTNPQQLDPGGHGTHIAGTVAGDGSRSAQQYMGVAPRANVIDVKVLDQNGNGRTSSLLAGLQWVIGHRSQYNIRVANLSLGAPAQGSYISDPVAAATELAWRSGIVVVVASGNLGPNAGTVETPGTDPYVITVGSTDDQGLLALSNSALGWWSSWGTPPDSTLKPDFVAPGRRVVAPLVPGSLIATRLADHIVVAANGSSYIRLTGTSMSTGVASGVVALMLERTPGLTPDQVKKILTTTTQPFGTAAMPQGAGSGLVDANAATFSGTRGTNNAGLRQADALARTVYSGIYGVSPLAWKSLTYLGTNWLAFTWLTLPWTPPAWDNIVWDNIAWDNIVWDNIAWDNIAWDNIAWDNIAWDSAEWNNIAWDNIAWD